MSTVSIAQVSIWRQTCHHGGPGTMPRFRAVSTVQDVVTQDVEALGPDRCQDLRGEVVIVAGSVEAGEAEFLHFVAVGSTP
jgi:hypothetical protein